LLTSKALSNVQAIRWESFAVRYEDGSNQQVATHDDGGEGLREPNDTSVSSTPCACEPGFALLSERRLHVKKGS
jgi:hypothetical protein